MDDQNEAWRRLTDARLKMLEEAIDPRRVRRNRAGRPVRSPPYEPGDRLPLTKWLELRVLAIELLLQSLIEADTARSEVQEQVNLLSGVLIILSALKAWGDGLIEPDFFERELIAAREQAEIILLESHSWPLDEEG